MIGHGVPGLDIRQDHEFVATASAVFAALTIGMDAWWPVSARLTGQGGHMHLVPELGAKLTELGPGGSGVIWGVVDAIDPDRRIYIQGWFGVRGVVAGRVHFDLEPSPSGCRLKLAHQAIGPVPEDQNPRIRTMWREILDGALRRYLTGTPV